MTIMKKCDMCGAMEEQSRDVADTFMSVHLFKYNNVEISNHYCPSCASKIEEFLGIRFKTFDEYEERYVRPVRVE